MCKTVEEIAVEALKIAMENRETINALVLQNYNHQQALKVWEEERKIRDIVESELNAREDMRAELENV